MHSRAHASRSHRSKTEHSHTDNKKKRNCKYARVVQIGLPCQSQQQNFDLSLPQPPEQQIQEQICNQIPAGITQGHNSCKSESKADVYSFGESDLIKYSQLEQKIRRNWGNASNINKFSRSADKIAAMLSYIQKPISYQELEWQQIIQERKMLQGHVKLLNKHLNKIFKQQFAQKQKQIRQRQKLKACKSFDNQLSQVCAGKQVDNNEELIAIMLKEYNFLSRRLQVLEASDKTVEDEDKIVGIKEEIRLAKLDIIDKKYKIALKEKNIRQKNKEYKEREYFDLQQEYIRYSMKKEQYQRQAGKIEKARASVAIQGRQTAAEYSRLSESSQQLNSEFQKYAQIEHTCQVYEDSKKKLQLAKKNKQRKEHNLKRAYFELLKQYEKVGEGLAETQLKIEDTNLRLESYSNIFQDKRNQLAEIKSMPKDMNRFSPIQSSLYSDFMKMPVKAYKGCNEQGFMLTEVSTQKQRLKVSEDEKDEDGDYTYKINKTKKISIGKNGRYHTEQTPGNRSYEYKPGHFKQLKESHSREMSQLLIKGERRSDKKAEERQSQFQGLDEINAMNSIVKMNYQKQQQQNKEMRLWLASQISNRNSRKSSAKQNPKVILQPGVKEDRGKSAAQTPIANEFKEGSICEQTQNPAHQDTNMQRSGQSGTGGSNSYIHDLQVDAA